MSRTLVQLAGLQTNGIGLNVQALPARMDILALMVEVQSGTCLIGDIGPVQLFGNTEMLHDYSTGAQLNDLNQYDKGATYVGNNILRLDLERLGMKSIQSTYGSTLKINPPANGNNQGDGSAIAEGLPAGTPVFTSGRLEFTVAATAVAPSFRVWAEVERDADWKTGAGAVMRRKRFTETVAGTSEQGFSKWTFGNKQFRYIRRAFLAISAGTIDMVRVQADGKDIFKRPRLVNNYAISQYGFHTAPAGQWIYVVDFTENGMAEDLDTLGIGELTWNITASVGGTLTALVEYGGSER